MKRGHHQHSGFAGISLAFFLLFSCATSREYEGSIERGIGPSLLTDNGFRESSFGTVTRFGKIRTDSFNNNLKWKVKTLMELNYQVPDEIQQPEDLPYRGSMMLYSEQGMSLEYYSLENMEDYSDTRLRKEYQHFMDRENGKLEIREYVYGEDEEYVDRSTIYSFDDSGRITAKEDRYRFHFDDTGFLDSYWRKDMDEELYYYDERILTYYQ